MQAGQSALKSGSPGMTCDWVTPKSLADCAAARGRRSWPRMTGGAWTGRFMIVSIHEIERARDVELTQNRIQRAAPGGLPKVFRGSRSIAVGVGRSVSNRSALSGKRAVRRSGTRPCKSLCTAQEQARKSGHRTVETARRKHSGRVPAASRLLDRGRASRERIGLASSCQSPLVAGLKACFD